MKQSSRRGRQLCERLTRYPRQRPWRVGGVGQCLMEVGGRMQWRGRGNDRGIVLAVRRIGRRKTSQAGGG